MIHPDFEILDENEDQLLHFKRIVPIYSETEGITSKNIETDHVAGCAGLCSSAPESHP